MNEPNNAQKSWFSRNWKWFVPTLAAGCIAIPVSMIAIVMLLVFGFIKGMTPYKVAVQEATTDQRVIDLVGEPVQAGWWVTGSTEINGPNGSAALMFPVSGPDGTLTIYVDARRAAGVWTYKDLVAESEATKQRINLLPMDSRA